jgi:hypothetical protein
MEMMRASDVYATNPQPLLNNPIKKFKTSQPFLNVTLRMFLDAVSDNPTIYCGTTQGLVTLPVSA